MQYYKFLNCQLISEDQYYYLIVPILVPIHSLCKKNSSSNSESSTQFVTLGKLMKLFETGASYVECLQPNCPVDMEIIYFKRQSYHRFFKKFCELGHLGGSVGEVANS